LAAVLPLWRALSPGWTLSWRDTALLFEPVRSLVVESLRAFRLPLWNPYEGAGETLLAQSIHAVLHPVTVATAFLGVGIDVQLLGLVAFGAAGAFVAARTLGASTAAASGAAFTFALSGYVLGMTGNAFYLTASATAPWTVAGLRVAADRGGRAVIAGAIAVGCAALAGDPQSLVAGTLVGAALGIGAAPRASPTHARRVARIAAAVVLGCGLGAVQLVPSWAYFQTTYRAAAGIAAPERAHWALDPVRLVELVAPGFFVGRVRAWEAPAFQALGAPSAYPLPWSPSVFVGIAALLLAAVAAARSREGRILAALAAAFAWMALGSHLGAAQLLSRVPIWGSFTYAEKLVGPLTLCLALAAGLGVDVVQRAAWLPRVAVGAAVAFFAVAIDCAAGPSATMALLRWLGAGWRAADLARAHLLEGSTQAVFGAVVLAAAAWLAPRLGKALGPTLAVLLFAESALASPFAIHLGRASGARACPPPLEAAAPGPRLLTAVVHNVTASEGGLDPIDVALKRWGHVGLPALNVACAVDSIEGYTGIESLRAASTIYDREQRAALAARFGVTHVLSERPEDRGDATALQQATREGRVVALDAAAGTAVFSVPHRPWASFAPAARAAGSIAAAGVALGEEVSAGRSTVVVEAETPPACAEGRVLAVTRGREEVAIEAESAGDALLVVNDAFDAGWRASIDGRPTAVLAADVLVRAVRWPAGRHRLLMRYEPPEVATGKWITVGTAFALLAWGASAWVARRGR
jgi:hypothetical protein